MKKFVIKALVAGLTLFDSFIINRLTSEWVKKLAKLATSRLKLFADALIDSNENDKEQLEQIAKETLISTEFVDLNALLTKQLADSIENQHLVKMILFTETLRLKLLALLVDEDKNNKAQVKQLLEEFVKSEDFDSIAISLAELVTDKYAKDPLVKQYLVSLVTTLVNSDDNN